MTTSAAATHESSASAAAYPLDGGCSCRWVRYRMQTHPLFVHCCHCRWCQRETGSAFVMNAMIESDRVVNLGVAPELVDTPSESGEGQVIARCPHCHVAVWSHYPGAGPMLKFLRVGTLDEPDRLPPDIHIFTASKQPWVMLPANVPAVPEFYDREKYWPADSLARRRTFLPSIEAYHHELKQRQIVNTRLVHLPRERLFQAFCDPARLARWWGPSGFRSTFATFDFRPGGHWVFTLHGPDGRDYANESVFVDVTAPARVRLRHVSDPKFELLVTLAEEEGGTRIRWRQRFGSADECERIAGSVAPKNEENLDRWVKEAGGGEVGNG
jgi:uncharacterized protein YndB with AHSA1/START domain